MSIRDSKSHSKFVPLLKSTQCKLQTEITTQNEVIIFIYKVSVSDNWLRMELNRQVFNK